MEPLYSADITTGFGKKSIEIYCSDILEFDEGIDILTVSAFVKSYFPTPRTMIKALYDVGISVKKLSKDPFIDLRKSCHTWLSEEILTAKRPINRIGCIELIDLHTEKLSYDTYSLEQSILNSIRAYFRMLETASIYNVKIETIALPILGTGRQHIDSAQIIRPLLNECLTFLKRNSETKRICFIESNPQKAQMLTSYIKDSLNLNIHKHESIVQPQDKQETLAFISYASADKNIADNLCFKLEQQGVKAWYAPRDVRGPYAESISLAIDKCSHFIVILSQNSINSQHVLNEIDLAFQGLPNNIKFKPLKIDNAIFTPSFKYYLSRQHWMDATVPPLEDRLNEFIDNLLSDL